MEGSGTSDFLWALGFGGLGCSARSYSFSTSSNNSNGSFA